MNDFKYLVLNTLNNFGEFETPVIFHRQKSVIDALKKGEIEDIRVSHSKSIDKIVSFGLKNGFLKEGLKSFPDPRKNSSVPIDALLMSQILQSLNDEHSLLLAPYMLNNAGLITELGYNVKVLEEGFNDQNTHDRKTAFHGETLKHILNQTKADSSIKWFNEGWLPLWRACSPGRTHQYILDGMKIEVPPHLANKYQGSGIVKDEFDNITFGYKVVWLQEIIDQKGVIVALTIVPIETHDLEAAKPLIKDFPFEAGSVLIADRAFIDSEWISDLKKNRKVDTVIPLKKNMEATVDAVALVDQRNMWEPHPTRKDQWVAELKKEDESLYWKDCKEIKSGALVRFNKKDGTPHEVLFVTTKDRISAKKILAIYDQRMEIEESHRQLKCNLGIENLKTKKFTHIVFKILMSVIGFNLLMLFLNSEECKSFEEYSIKTLRQKQVVEPNPQVIVYTKTAFGILKLYELLPMLMEFEKAVQTKLVALFKKLNI